MDEEKAQNTLNGSVMMRSSMQLPDGELLLFLSNIYIGSLHSERKFVTTNMLGSTVSNSGSVMGVSQSQGMISSSMLDKEKKELEKIKFR
jgi:hypothetical protein